MKTLGLAGAIALIALVIIAWHWQRALEAGLPPRIDCASEAEAKALAGPGAIPVLGTGSMAPLIPAAAPGRDPLSTCVAYVATVPGATYADITRGSLCVYRAEWSPIYRVMHCAANRDRLGWIMSGLHNAHSEPGWRVTEQNFIALAARVYVWPQPTTP